MFRNRFCPSCSIASTSWGPLKNDRVWTKGGEVKSRVVTRKQGSASVMVWAAVSANGFFFVDQNVKLKQEKYQKDILERSLLTRAKIPQKDIRAACKAFSKRLQFVIDAKGGHIE